MDDLSAITRKVIELKLDQNIYTVIEEILWNENAKSISAAAYNFIVETGISEDVADLVQDGYFGFLKAIDTYDPNGPSTCVTVIHSSAPTASTAS